MDANAGLLVSKVSTQSCIFISAEARAFPFPLISLLQRRNFLIWTSISGNVLNSHSSDQRRSELKRFLATLCDTEKYISLNKPNRSIYFLAGKIKKFRSIQ